MLNPCNVGQRVGAVQVDHVASLIARTPPMQEIRGFETRSEQASETRYTHTQRKLNHVLLNLIPDKHTLTLRPGLPGGPGSPEGPEGP